MIYFKYLVKGENHNFIRAFTKNTVYILVQIKLLKIKRKKHLNYIL